MGWWVCWGLRGGSPSAVVWWEAAGHWPGQGGGGSLDGAHSHPLARGRGRRGALRGDKSGQLP